MKLVKNAVTAVPVALLSCAVVLAESPDAIAPGAPLTTRPVARIECADARATLGRPH